MSHFFAVDPSLIENKYFSPRNISILRGGEDRRRGQKSPSQQGREQQPQQTQLPLLNSHLHGFLFGIGTRATLVGGESGGGTLLYGLGWARVWILRRFGS